jgi:hypothetical protein
LAREAVMSRRRPMLAGFMWLLTLLFLLRVLGQLVQYSAAHPALPPFESFQGSNLPYWVLLPAQIVILFLMALYSWRVQAGSGSASPRAGRVLAWLGGFYLAVSLGRIAVGLAVEGAPSWFTAWISAALHVVLAAFVLSLAYHHAVDDPGERKR